MWIVSAHPAETVSIRDLRNSGGDVVDRVAHGERLIITRDGERVAEIVPLARKPLTRNALLARWSRLPRLDAESFREDVDAVVDQTIHDPDEA